MIKNESNIDRIIRAVIGAVLLYLAFFSGSAFFATGFWHWLAIIVGIAMIITAITGFCALYKIIGVNTNKKDK